ncbi:MAG: hypothetical protein ABSB79_11730, partial [Syntrophales bacterium]
WAVYHNRIALYWCIESNHLLVSLDNIGFNRYYSSLDWTPYRRIGKVMSRKKMIMITMVIGSFVGAYVPALLGADSLSLSLLGSVIGGVIGVWLGYHGTV